MPPKDIVFSKEEEQLMNEIADFEKIQLPEEPPQAKQSKVTARAEAEDEFERMMDSIEEDEAAKQKKYESSMDQILLDGAEQKVKSLRDRIKEKGIKFEEFVEECEEIEKLAREIGGSNLLREIGEINYQCYKLTAIALKRQEPLRSENTEIASRLFIANAVRYLGEACYMESQKNPKDQNGQMLKTTEYWLKMAKADNGKLVGDDATRPGASTFLGGASRVSGDDRSATKQ